MTPGRQACVRCGSTKEDRVICDPCHLGLDRACRANPEDHSWSDLMAILDAVYPADVFGDGSTDNPDADPGPRIVGLLRQIDSIRQSIPNQENPQ